MDIANYADMGGNVRRVTHDTDHSVWRAEGTDGQGNIDCSDLSAMSGSRQTVTPR